MPNILDEIIEYKKLFVQHSKMAKSLDQLKDETAGLEKCRNFHKAVIKKNPHKINVIAEVKKASPSAGLIRENFDPLEIAKTYQSCGADAISCLTDVKYFQGKLEFIPLIKKAVDIPVLRKDFIIDEYQVYEARAAGADAILLIAEALPVGKLMDLMILANKLTLGCLIEVHGAETLMNIRSMVGFPHTQYNVIGVNNRDLTTMKVDINNTARMKDMLEGGMPIIAESGIRTRADVEKMIKIGANAILIGQTLCQSGDISEKFKELFH